MVPPGLLSTNKLIEGVGAGGILKLTQQTVNRNFSLGEGDCCAFSFEAES